MLQTPDVSALEHIERCGRVCYKSEDQIKEGSAERFVRSLIKRGHEAVLEHASFIFEADCRLWKAIREISNSMEDWGRKEDAVQIPYKSYLRFTSDYSNDHGFAPRYIVSGNVRAWRAFFFRCKQFNGTAPCAFQKFAIQNPVLFPEYQDPASFQNSVNGFLRQIDKNDLRTNHEKLVHYDVTVLFTCDRGVSHEIVRHRPASFCQESTRYCNYSKGAFGSELTVIEPCFWETGSAPWIEWRESCADDEVRYFSLLDFGASPQEARSVLPNSLKTEVVMTANLGEWRHFFNLRCAPAAHPQMQEVALIALDKLASARIPKMFKDLWQRHFLKEGRTNAEL